MTYCLCTIEMNAYLCGWYNHSHYGTGSVITIRCVYKVSPIGHADRTVLSMAVSWFKTASFYWAIQLNERMNIPNWRLQQGLINYTKLCKFGMVGLLKLNFLQIELIICTKYDNNNSEILINNWAFNNAFIKYLFCAENFILRFTNIYSSFCHLVLWLVHSKFRKPLRERTKSYTGIVSLITKQYARSQTFQIHFIIFFCVASYIML